MSLSSEIERVRKGVRAIRFYRSCVRPGNLCFDVGANKGSRAVIFTLLGARTIAVEPNDRLTRTLRRVPRVTVVNKAVSDQPGSRKILFNANDQISSLNPNWQNKWPDFPDWSEQTVDCVTLDLLIEAHGMPDFCKIDVEGHEPAVLAGLSKPIPFISFEAAPDFRANTEACISHLAGLGEYEFNFSIGDEFTWVGASWVGGQKVRDFVKSEAGDIYGRLKRR